ncbi:unnamed protein product [Adineta ricciae]|nr:unnamed protein product [Adineta ricciae]
MTSIDTSVDVNSVEDCLDTYIDINYEPRVKRTKLLMTSLMDKNVSGRNRSSDKVDQYIKLTLDCKSCYTNPLMFWKQSKYHLAFPNLARLAKYYFSIPCSSASPERQFSAAGYIVNQRRFYFRSFNCE